MKKLILGTLLATTMVTSAFAVSAPSSNDGIGAIILLTNLENQGVNGPSVSIPSPSTEMLKKTLGASELKQSAAQSYLVTAYFKGQAAEKMLAEHEIKQNIEQQQLYCAVSKNMKTDMQLTVYVCALDKNTALNAAGRS